MNDDKQERESHNSRNNQEDACAYEDDRACGCGSGHQADAHAHAPAHVSGGVDHPATKMHMSEVEDLPSLVSIQPEATVSRTVLSEDGLRIVLFAFDKGQVLTEHTAAMPVMLQVSEGRLLITADGRDTELVPGKVIYFSTRLPHTVEALEPSKMMLSMFDTRQH